MFECKVRDGDVEVVLLFEHSLLSLSKWESKHRKVFLSEEPKNADEMIEYFQAMLLTPDVDVNLVYVMSPEQLEALSLYINTPQTATVVPDQPVTKPWLREPLTTELIYYQLTALKINWEAQHWHLSRCMKLIELTSYKMQPEKKEKARPGAMAEWREINERQKKMFNTNG